MSYQYVGQSVTRPDAVRKVTGKAYFLDDLKLPRMLYAAFLRPEHAHAKILAIDTTEAEKCPGVVKVVTGKGCQIRYGENIRDWTPLAVEKVRYIGEPVAAVIAENPNQAREAVKKIKAQYEPLPVYVDAREAMKEGATLIHENSGDYWHLPGVGPKPGTNIANHYRLKKGDIEKGFKEADVTIEEEFVYPFGSCSAIEPHGAIVWFHEDKTIEVWSSSICPFVIREDIAHAYHRPISDVRVHIPELGGCFGYKSDITIEQTVAYVASFVPGRPVKWVATRKEDILSTLLGHGMRVHFKVGAKKDGRLTAIQAKVLHATGGFSDTGLHVSIAAGHNCTGPYEFPHCLLDSYLVYTNTTPIGAFRGYGHPEGQFGIERIMDMLARKLNLSPFELRDRNYLGPGKQTSLGETLNATNGNVQDCVDVVKQAVYAAAPKPKEDDQYFYGRGFAALMKSPKGAPFSSKSCYLKFNVDGSVSINMGGAEVGQGLRTVVQQVAAEALKIPVERIKVYTEIDTQFSPWEWQTIGSMFTTQGGRAILRAAGKAIAMLKKTAAQVLRCDEDMLEYDGEFVFLKSDPTAKVEVKRLIHGYITDNGITIGEVVHAVSDARIPRYSGPDANGQGNLGVEYTFGAQACDIRIEKKTGKVIVDHFASSFDVGKVINPRQIRGQITGGVMMGIGATLYEEVRFDQDGKPLNASFSKMRFPNIKDAPRKQTVQCVENPAVVGPFGARGIGEHPLVGVAPAILNAIYDAIGVEFTEIPVTPEKIMKALESKKA